MWNKLHQWWQTMSPPSEYETHVTKTTWEALLIGGQPIEPHPQLIEQEITTLSSDGRIQIRFFPEHNRYYIAHRVKQKTTRKEPLDPA